jgi:hypothetical protein
LYRKVPRLRLRTILLAATVLFSAVSFVRFGVLVTIIVMTAGVTTTVILSRRRTRRTRPGKTGGSWRPTVQHQELPPPSEDPVINYSEPTLEQFASREPPLAALKLDGGIRTQLDGFALGRAKRIIEAPDLLPHAAADPESWPVVEASVQKTLELARSRGVQLNAGGLTEMQKAIALSAAQGVLLAEWRQLDDGKTMWQGTTARVRASDAFAIQRISESMERRLLPDLFAGVERRPQDFELRLLLPYALSTAYYMRLRGNPPAAFAAA